MTKVISVDPENPDIHAIRKAATVIKKGGVVAYPTCSFYALGVDSFKKKSIERVYRLKQRDSKKPLLILIGDLKNLFPLVKEVPSSASRLIDKFWPGALTIVFEAAESLPSNLTGNTGKIGIRLDDHRVATLLANISGTPITGTSANISGRMGCVTIFQIFSQFGQGLDLILEAGSLPGGNPSTIVDVTFDPPKVLREGMVDIARIKHVQKVSVI
nr:threonylcarbamoyl-AMP synthase [Desulfobacterales bacterium]